MMISLSISTGESSSSSIQREALLSQSETWGWEMADGRRLGRHGHRNTYINVEGWFSSHAIMVYSIKVRQWWPLSLHALPTQRLLGGRFPMLRQRKGWSTDEERKSVIIRYLSRSSRSYAVRHSRLKSPSKLLGQILRICRLFEDGIYGNPI